MCNSEISRRKSKKSGRKKWVFEGEKKGEKSRLGGKQGYILATQNEDFRDDNFLILAPDLLPDLANIIFFCDISPFVSWRIVNLDYGRY